MEWGRSERLETNRLTLERENKRLRSEIDDVLEQLEAKRNVEATIIQVR